METFEVLEPGMFTTIQNLGRHGYQQYGIPVSGAMDTYALRVANILLGNEEGEACLEITLIGPQLKVLEDTVIAITGADLGPQLDKEPLPMWETVPVRRGSIISFKGLKSGSRAYLAVAGGIDVPEVLGSKSTYVKAQLGGIDGRPLRKGSRLRTGPVKSAEGLAGRKAPPGSIPRYNEEHELRVVLGPQDDYFTQEGIHTFLNSQYVVSIQADRMGYRLEGLRIAHKAGADIISDGIPLGAVQVPGDGLPIILMADRQTTGGYTKIATVITADIHKVAQAKPGDKIRFVRVSEGEAYVLFRQYEESIQNLRTQMKQPALATAHSAIFKVRVNGRLYEVEVEGID
ncbi:MAG: biotin-dependent carboxyltransferase family protein [Chloroflexi bacterium]|nr:biotin-dependent carboxyltransferase family protein [Chloroflexota bacterium]